MKQIDKASFGALYYRPRMVRLIKQSTEIINHAFEISGAGRPYIAISGGKDSLVVGQLCRDSGDGDTFDYWWGDDGWDYPETLIYLDTLAKYWGIEIKKYDSVGIKEKFKRFVNHGVGDNNYWVAHDAIGHSQTMGMKDLGYDIVFLGLRKEESKQRKLSLTKTGAIHYIEREKMWHCNPIANWKTEDVWAYIIGRGIPYNPVYDKLEELGVELKFRRVGPLTAYMVWQYGMISVLKRGWPELYNRFAAEVPEIARYI